MAVLSLHAPALGQSDKSAYLKATESGAAVRIVALGVPPTRRWWQPGGNAVSANDVRDATPGAVPKLAVVKQRVALLYVWQARRESIPGVATRFNGVVRPAAFVTPVDRRDFLSLGPYVWAAAVAPARKARDLEVGVADGPWETVAQGPPSSRLRFFRGIRIDAEPSQNGYGVFVSVSMPPSVRSRDVRVVAFDARGRELRAGGCRRAANGMPIEFAFKAKTRQVARIALQTRPYDWVRFQGVALWPLPREAGE